MSDFDITIIGGGLAGVSFAHALQNYPGRVALIEKHEGERLQRDTFDERSIVLADVSRRIFNTMGLWEALMSANR